MHSVGPKNMLGRCSREEAENARWADRGPPGPTRLGQARSFAAVLILNLLVIAMCAFILLRSHQQDREKAVLVADNLSRVLDENLSRLIDKIDLTLLSVADEAERQMRESGRIDRLRFEEVIRRHDVRLPEANGLRVSDVNGIISYAVSKVEVPNVDVSDREYFVRQRDDPDAGLFISAPFVGRIYPHPQVIFSRRYRAGDGSFAGIVDVSFPVDALMDLLSGVDLGPNGTVSLWDRQQKLMARFSRLPNPAPEGARPTAELAALIRADGSATTYHTRSNIDGVQRVFFSRKVSRWPLYLVVGVADDDFMAGWWQELAILGGLAGLFMIASVGAYATFLRTLRVLERARQQADQARRQSEASEERYRALFEHMQTGFTLREVIADDTGQPVDCRFLAANPAFLNTFGLRAEELVGKRMTEVWPELAVKIPNWIATFDEVARTGRSAHFETYGVATGRWIEAMVYRTGPNRVAVLSTDITERKRAEEKIQELAYFDGLTGLPNRRLLMDRLRQALIATARTRRRGGLLFVDLDNFKTLNDSFGHAQGDQLLVQVAGRLTSTLREGDTVARLGGDEFVVVLEDLSGDSSEAAAQITAVGEKILAVLAEPHAIAGQDHVSTASVGAALFGEQRESLDDLLKRADIAMYQAKAAGRNTLRFFDPTLQAVVRARASMEEALRRAIGKGEFTLHYQPQVDRGYLVGVEALLRWHSPERGQVSPAEFIPVAEESGLILPLGQWVLETACRQIAAWAGRPQTRHITVAVNVSARQFRQAGFVEQVREVLRRTSANPLNLKLELTESMLLDNVDDVIAKMTALKSEGLSFSLDDFGTGYSSLSYLKRLPLDQLKIDQSFVRDLLADLNSGAIAQTIIALGQGMGLSVIAEGVETREQWDFLARLGCHACQGYLFGRPLPLEELEALVARSELLVPMFSEAAH